MAAQPSVPGLRRARESLLESLAAVMAEAVGTWPPILQRAANAHGLPVHWRGRLADEPAIAAVRVGHAGGMGPPGNHAWVAG
jgi:hypothetical protein